MTEWKCHHGFTFAQACKQCEVETARAFLEHWGDAVDAAREVIAASTVINQCDGCRSDAPLTERGNHRYSDGSLIGCSKSLYVEPGTEES